MVKKPATSELDARFVRVVNAFANDPSVSRGDGKGFGVGALKVNGKIFAMMTPGDSFVVKLPKERVADLIGSGRGERFDPGHGRLMKEWIVVSVARGWVELAREAHRFVKGGQD